VELVTKPSEEAGGPHAGRRDAPALRAPSRAPRGHPPSIPFSKIIAKAAKPRQMASQAGAFPVTSVTSIRPSPYLKPDFCRAVGSTPVSGRQSRQSPAGLVGGRSEDRLSLRGNRRQSSTLLMSGEGKQVGYLSVPITRPSSTLRPHVRRSGVDPLPHPRETDHLCKGRIYVPRGNHRGCDDRRGGRWRRSHEAYGFAILLLLRYD
jgi:hypothetical protein